MGGADELRRRGGLGRPRRPRCCRTLALPTLIPMVAAASLMLSVSRKRSSRICRYRSGRHANNRSARTPASESVCGSFKKRKAAASSILVASVPKRRRQYLASADWAVAAR